MDRKIHSRAGVEERHCTANAACFRVIRGRDHTLIGNHVDVFTLVLLSTFFSYLAKCDRRQNESSPSSFLVGEKKSELLNLDGRKVGTLLEAERGELSKE